MPPGRRQHGQRNPNPRPPQQQRPHNQRPRPQRPRNPRRRPGRGGSRSNTRPPRRGSQRLETPPPPYATPQSQRRHNHYLRRLEGIQQQGTNAMRELGDLMAGIAYMQEVMRNGQTMDWEPHSTVVYEGVSVSPPRTAVVVVGPAAPTGSSAGQEVEGEREREGAAAAAAALGGGGPCGSGARSSVREGDVEGMSPGRADGGRAGVTDE